ncbi:MAG: SIS domain-containing protein [Ardenticatenaceae bacterium]|nr:SIS domain-containing protein [Ardenticatenaceae bacterium]HBY95485.1 phosphoheptose isomerase [Chloroflexota bacterium]
MRDDIELYWRELVDVTRTMPFAALARMAELLLECHGRSGTIFILGNGGSAATASHFACDLAKGTQTEGIPAFRVVPLTDNVPLLTAWANDTSYDRVFAEQLAALIRPGDVVVAISTSGDSPNVLEATRLARKVGATTVALTGQSGGRLRRLADLTIRVPAGPIEQVEDAHLVIAHSLCVALRQRMRAEARPLAGERPALQEAVDASVALEIGG